MSNMFVNKTLCRILEKAMSCIEICHSGGWLCVYKQLISPYRQFRYRFYVKSFFFFFFYVNSIAVSVPNYPSMHNNGMVLQWAREINSYWGWVYNLYLICSFYYARHVQLINGLILYVHKWMVFSPFLLLRIIPSISHIRAARPKRSKGKERERRWSHPSGFGNITDLPGYSKLSHIWFSAYNTTYWPSKGTKAKIIQVRIVLDTILYTPLHSRHYVWYEFQQGRNVERFIESVRQRNDYWELVGRIPTR